MLNKIIRYPLDKTGTNPNNAVVGEIHDLPNRRIRAIATDYGAYFVESLVVVDLATNQTLTKDQYRADTMYALPTGWTGKEICAIILITDSNVSNNVMVSYQALGGEFSYSATAVIQQIEALDLDDRPVKWGDILGKPDRFPPDYHLHDIGDLYGFEYVVHALEQIRQAILLGDAASHDQIYRYIDDVIAKLTALLDGQKDQLNMHLIDYFNPHRVTAAQVGAYTKAAVDALISQLTTTVNTHINDLGNPHQVKAHQTGAYESGEVDQLLANLNSQLRTDFGIEVTGATGPYTLSRQDVGKYLRMTNVGTVIVPANMFNKNEVVYIRAGNGAVTVSASPGMTINLPIGQNNVLHGTGATVALVFISPTQADLIGSTRYV